MQAGGKGGGGPIDLDDDGIMEPEELAFAHEDERLPWLEGDDDAEEPGVDTGRVIAFVVGALILLGAAIGALWWFFHDRSETAMTFDVPSANFETFETGPGSVVKNPPERFGFELSLQLLKGPALPA